MSDNPLPNKIQQYIESWKKILPDYQIIKWDYHNFPRGTSKWVDEAFDSQKFAFAADYIRAYALYNFGGIYLDSDVEIIKSFNSLLTYPYFMGYDSGGYIEAAIMGTEKGNPFFKMLLDYYDNKNFLNQNHQLEITPLPHVINSLIKDKFKIINIFNPNQFDYSQNSLCILPNDYFSPKSHINGKIYKTKRTYTIHHYSGSWLSLSQKFYVKIRDIFGYKIANTISKTYKHILKKIGW